MGIEIAPPTHVRSVAILDQAVFGPSRSDSSSPLPAPVVMATPERSQVTINITTHVNRGVVPFAPLPEPTEAIRAPDSDTRPRAVSDVQITINVASDRRVRSRSRSRSPAPHPRTLTAAGERPEADRG